MKYIVTSYDWRKPDDAIKAGYTSAIEIDKEIIIAVSDRIIHPDKEFILYESDGISEEDINGMTAMKKMMENMNKGGSDSEGNKVD